MTRKLLPLVVLVLALVGAIAWWAVRDARVHGLERADNSRPALPSEARTEVSTESQPLEARSAENGEVGAASDAGGSTAGTGTLRLRVLDEKTRAPIPDLQFMLYRERGGEKELARGKTDKEGRATLSEIEANTVIVRTERKPPHAEAYGAVWLTAGATKELELLVGAGGAVTGRVVDDLQKPVAGAKIFVDGYHGGIRAFGNSLREADAESTSDGRFRLENVACWPGAVWVVDGEMRPQAWNGIRFTAGTENVAAWSQATPIPDKDVDVGDIELRRATTYAGVVLDPEGRPVAGALVTYRQGREFARRGASDWSPALAVGPGQPEFKLLPGESLSSAAGTFELKGDGKHPWVGVWTMSDQFQGFSLPMGKPGERVEGVELKLASITRVELELVDANGEPAKLPRFVPTAGELYTPWRTGQARTADVLTLISTSSDGKQLGEHASKPGADGKWRLELLADSAHIEKLEVWASGYEPSVERSSSGFPALIRRRIVVSEFPSFQIRLMRKDKGSKLLEAPGVVTHLHVCMADPARHAAKQECCGFGVYWNGSWRGEPLALTLPVRRKGSYWIYASAKPQGFGRDVDLASWGPFVTDLEEHELVVDLSSFVARKQEEQQKPPEPSAPGAEEKARLRAHIVDARTGKGLEGASISLVEVKRAWARGVGADAQGEVRDAPVSVGRWSVLAQARGHKHVDVGERTTIAGETLELGTIALEPVTMHRGRLFGADGVALTRESGLVLLNPLPGVLHVIDYPVQRDGSFEFFDAAGGLPAKLLLQVQRAPQDPVAPFEYQRFWVDLWPESELKELKLAPARRVVVTLLGVDAEESALVPGACPAPGEATALCDHRIPLDGDHHPLAYSKALDSISGSQRYAFLLAPGRYQVWGSNLMHELPVTDLEVTPGDTDLELTITAH